MNRGHCLQSYQDCRSLRRQRETSTTRENRQHVLLLDDTEHPTGALFISLDRGAHTSARGWFSPSGLPTAHSKRPSSSVAGTEESARDARDLRSATLPMHPAQARVDAPLPKFSSRSALTRFSLGGFSLRSCVPHYVRGRPSVLAARTRRVSSSSRPSHDPSRRSSVDSLDGHTLFPSLHH
jgi:hypothetical protein